MATSTTDIFTTSLTETMTTDSQSSSEIASPLTTTLLPTRQSTHSPVHNVLLSSAATIDDHIWTMSTWGQITVCIILTLQFIISTVANSLLITTILTTPPLRVPSNSQLVSVSINNLLASVLMAMYLSTMFMDSSNVNSILQASISSLFHGFIIFTKVTVLLQYWISFSTIGYYRMWTLRRRPGSASGTHHRILIGSLKITWVLTVVTSMLVCVSFRYEVPPPSELWWNPFVTVVTKEDLDFTLSNLEVEQRLILLLLLLMILVQVFIIIPSYHYITRVFLSTRWRWSQRNKVLPHMPTSSSSGVAYATDSGDEEDVLGMGLHRGVAVRTNTNSAQVYPGRRSRDHSGEVDLTVFTTLTATITTAADAAADAADAAAASYTSSRPRAPSLQPPLSPQPLNATDLMGEAVEEFDDVITASGDEEEEYSQAILADQPHQYHRHTTVGGMSMYSDGNHNNHSNGVTSGRGRRTGDAYKVNDTSMGGSDAGGAGGSGGAAGGAGGRLFHKRHQQPHQQVQHTSTRSSRGWVGAAGVGRPGSIKVVQGSVGRNTYRTSRKSYRPPPPLVHTRSASSITSRPSGGDEEDEEGERDNEGFTDISPAGIVQRQVRERERRTRRQATKRDRLGAMQATRNSLVMLCVFLVLTVPLVLCGIPGVVSVPGGSTHCYKYDTITTSDAADSNTVLPISLVADTENDATEVMYSSDATTDDMFSTGSTDDILQHDTTLTELPYTATTTTQSSTNTEGSITTVATTTSSATTTSDSTTTTSGSTTTTGSTGSSVHTQYTHRSALLITVHLLFFMNATLFPLWYLSSSTHVRRSLVYLLDLVMTKLKITP